MALALYRRYRPDTFDGVIGQDQVVVPLARALDEGKLTHAYLFSGPRGCGKTSSARILARCINCEKGPTSHPCGECESCRDLSANGAGSIDVVEIDAASHNGVDDARELRERAGFAPARDRYKIFILDEAHMVTQQGFNALLKIVEEPPEHVMFIFATTEPEKVIGTIRSRTHHYPFRLVPTEIMGPFLEKVCAQEKIVPQPGVLKLAMRAGGGSVRDTLSVLDQLMVGSIGGEITYESASALLGFTPEALISHAIDAVIDRDGSALYSTIEKVVVGGFEPRRFVEDLLARVRDLLVLTLAGRSAVQVLSDESEGEDAEALSHQAQALGLSRLTLIAEKINATLATMSGATSPRMRLELLAAQLLAAMEEQTIVRSSAPSPSAGTTMNEPAAMSASRQTQQRGGFNPPPRQSPIETPIQQRTSAPQQTQPPAQQQISAQQQASGNQEATAAAAQMQQQSEPLSDMDLWKSVLRQMPQDLSAYVEESKVPIVEFSTNALGGKHLVFTFNEPLSQHAFALAVSNQNRGIPGLVQNEVRKVFGQTASIAPNSVAANGETVQTVSSMSPQQRAAVKRDIALGAMKSAVNGAAGISRNIAEEQREKETSPSGNDSDSDSEHHAASSEEASPADPTDVTDPWGSDPDDGFAAGPSTSSAAAEFSGANEIASEAAEENSPSTPQSNRAEETPQGIATDDAEDLPDDDDPWAHAEEEETVEVTAVSQPTDTSSDRLAEETSTPHFNPGTRNLHNAASSMASNQQIRETAQQEPSVAADDDTYSLDDRSLGASDVVDLETLKAILDVKQVNELPAPDPGR